MFMVNFLFFQNLCCYRKIISLQNYISQKTHEKITKTNGLTVNPVIVLRTSNAVGKNAFTISCNNRCYIYFPFTELFYKHKQ